MSYIVFITVFFPPFGAGAVRGDVVPGGGGLGERFRGDVRQGQHKRGRSVQGAAEPGEEQVRPGPVAETQFGAQTVATVRRRTRVDGAHAVATRAPSEESQRRRRRRRKRRRRRRRRQIKTQLVFDILKKKPPQTTLPLQGVGNISLHVQTANCLPTAIPLLFT